MYELFVRSRIVAMAAFGVIALSVAGCGGGGGGSAPVISSPQTSGGNGFTGTQSQALTSGGMPVPLPTGSGYGGTVTLPTPAATIPAHTTLNETMTNSVASASRLPQFITPQAGGTFLLYLELQFSSNVNMPLPALTLTVPSSDIIPNAEYYLAFDDPQASGGWPTGWQYAVEGPVQPNGNTLSFSGPTEGSGYGYNQAYPFVANSPVYFGLYEVGGTLPTPSPSPSGTPEPPIILNPSSLQINGLGYSNSSYSSIVDESGCDCSYSATSSNSNIASAYTDGYTVWVQGNATGFAGITVASSDGRTAILNVTVTATNVSIQGAHR
jgi:hypothetical protein